MSKLDQIKALGDAKRAARNAKPNQFEDAARGRDPVPTSAKAPNDGSVSRGPAMTTVKAAAARLPKGPVAATNSAKKRPNSSRGHPKGEAKPGLQVGDAGVAPSPRGAKRGRGRPKIEGQRPWETAGVSKTTYYRERRRAEQKGTQK